jgi:hypothetical protein
MWFQSIMATTRQVQKVAAVLCFLGGARHSVEHKVSAFGCEGNHRQEKDMHHWNSYVTKAFVSEHKRARRHSASLAA